MKDQPIERPRLAQGQKSGVKQSPGAAAMSLVQTLDQRKNARIEAIRIGFAALRERLAAYGRAHGGAFIVYGSAVSGKLHIESDIDVLVDFPAERMAAALSFVEATCADLDLKADVQPRSWCTTEFIDRIQPTALVLP
jgi:predicted nucleotidyltransferase